MFAIWPEFSCREEDLERPTCRWTCVSTLVKTGFDTTRYVCEILKHTIEWDIRPMYRIGTDTQSAHEEPETCWGTAICDYDMTPFTKRPFKMRLAIAAELIWQLLVDEYSPAEKASVSLNIAVTMLHELAVSGRLFLSPLDCTLRLTFSAAR